MTELRLSINEPFISPAWGAGFVLFSGGAPISEDSSKDYLRRVCRYARHHGVYLVPERFMLLGSQCLCLISPEGKVLGAQKGLFLGGVSKATVRGEDMQVLPTEFGGVCLCVDTDVYHPEIARVAAGMGARYMFCSQWIAPDDFGNWALLNGIWNAAQLARVYAAGVFGEGCCVCAPLDLTRGGDGFIVAPGKKLPVTASLDAGRLAKAEAMPGLNPSFYTRHRKALAGGLAGD